MSQTIQTSDTAKGLRMLRAVRALRDDLRSEGDHKGAEVLQEVMALPWPSMVTLAKAFESATAAA